jgi:putative transposase
MTIFESDADYAAFEQVLEEAVARTELRLLAYCVMPNHWHLVLWPQEDGELSPFMGWERKRCQDRMVLSRSTDEKSARTFG